jgi:hypothetical membrane protein
MKLNKLQILGLTGVIIAFFSIVLSIYPSYNFLTQFISELGVGPNALIFNFGMMISSILIIPFFYTQFSFFQFYL